MREHRYALGRHVKYIENGGRGRYWPDTSDPAWRGVYEITNPLPVRNYEPEYAIYDAEQADIRSPHLLPS